MSKIIKFGEDVEGYQVPVLNEREVRAAAGMLFLFAFTSLLMIMFKGNFLPIKFFIITFLFDFVIRVLINPKYAPTLIISRLIVKNQKPEYVGAPQKRFAWIIGLVLGVLMFFFLIFLNTYSIITGLICLICLIFLFFESVFGICLGCIFYNLLYKEKAKYCPGYTCEINERVAIQKISKSQLLMIVVFIAFVGLSMNLLSPTFNIKPQDLWIKYGSKQEAIK